MFDEVVIVGVGLLGASLGLALKARHLAKHVSGVGRAGSDSLEIALKRGAVDEGFTDLSAALGRNPDLVVLCVPVRQFPGAMEKLKGKLKPGAIVTDVGSTKGEVMGWANEAFGKREGARFVGSHPMAGSEKRGPAAARGDLYEKGLCFLCRGAGDADGAALAKVEAMWKGIGMRTKELEAGLCIDKWVGMVSHLPHAVAFSLVNAAGSHPEMLAAAAGGFLDTTRIASSDVEMWADIFLTNREAVVGAMDAFLGEMGKLRAAVARVWG